MGWITIFAEQTFISLNAFLLVAFGFLTFSKNPIQVPIHSVPKIPT